MKKLATLLSFQQRQNHMKPPLIWGFLSILYCRMETLFLAAVDRKSSALPFPGLFHTPTILGPSLFSLLKKWIFKFIKRY